MLKIRRSLGRLIFNMGIAIPGKTVLLIETAPCSQLVARQPGLSASHYSRAARHFLFRMGPRCGHLARSVNRLRQFRMVCVNIQAFWRPGVIAKVLVGGPHRIGVWGEYANPVTVWFVPSRHIAQ